MRGVKLVWDGKEETYRKIMEIYRPKNRVMLAERIKEPAVLYYQIEGSWIGSLSDLFGKIEAGEYIYVEQDGFLKKG